MLRGGIFNLTDGTPPGDQTIQEGDIDWYEATRGRAFYLSLKAKWQKPPGSENGGVAPDSLGRALPPGTEGGRGRQAQKISTGERGRAGASGRAPGPSVRCRSD